ncbi:MAG: hypothetical protein LBI96_04220 [Odoribacteraceae bacterium]|jgi:hypothetical protein|nr:hypothetical protein [Odoribacteraceae bacterium]
MNRITLFLLAAALLGGCNKNDAPRGGDNYILSLHLTRADRTIPAAIAGDSILVTMPGDFATDGIEATIVVSEKAVVTPDPATITAWETPREFTVTAANGQQRVYGYRASRDTRSVEGDVALLTQADVDALAATRPERINGALTIGAGSGADSVRSLAPLAGLRVVEGALTILPAYAGGDLAGLESLEKVGALRVAPSWGGHLDAIRMPSLVVVMSDLSIEQTPVAALEFPCLREVGGNLRLSDNERLAGVSFPSLVGVLGGLSVEGGWMGEQRLADIQLPALERVGGEVYIYDLPLLERLEMPSLAGASSVRVIALDGLVSLAMPRLERLPGDLDLSALPVMTGVDLRALRVIDGGCSFQNLYLLRNLDGIRELGEVGSLFFRGLPELESIAGLKKLARVGARLYLSDLPKLRDETLDGLSALARVGTDMIISRVPFKRFAGFSLSVTDLNLSDITGVEEIDVRGMTIANTLTIAGITAPFVLKGAAAFPANLSLGNAEAVIGEGFEEVRDLSYTMTIPSAAPRELAIRRVNGNASFNIYNFEAFRAPLLGEIAGTFNVATATGIQRVEFPMLARAGATTLSIAILPAFALPALVGVDGNCTITTGAYQGAALASLQMPALRRVDGALSISGQSYYPNTKLTNLDGFAALESARGVTVAYNTALADFTGLRGVLSSLTAAAWSVSGNAYNPSYAEMLEGLFVNP